jgi:hypothetical protein
LVDPVGNTIAGASVNLYSERKVIQAKTDSQGRFKFEHLEPGSYKLEAKVDGFQPKIVQPLKVEGDARPAQPLNLTLSGATRRGCIETPVSYEENIRGGASITGVIEPMPRKAEPNVDWRTSMPPSTSAIIDLVRLDGGSLIASTHPDEHGRFKFTSLPPGEYLLRSKLPGYDDMQTTSFQVMREDVTLVRIPMSPVGEEPSCE